jgi:hypothetical protein
VFCTLPQVGLQMALQPAPAAQDQDDSSTTTNGPERASPSLEAQLELRHQPRIALLPLQCALS